MGGERIQDSAIVMQEDYLRGSVEAEQTLEAGSGNYLDMQISMRGHLREHQDF